MDHAQNRSGKALRLAYALFLIVQLPATACGANAEASTAEAAAVASARQGALGVDDACGAPAPGCPNDGGGGACRGSACAVSALQRHSSKQGGGGEASGLGSGAASPLKGCQGLDCISQYVALDDGEFAWRDTGARVEGVDEEMSMPWKGYVLNVTSQRWLTEADIDHPLWWHVVVVVVPKQIQFPDWVTVNLAFGYYPDYPEGAEFLTPLTRIDNRHAYSRAQDALTPSIEITADNLLSSLPELQNAAAQVAAYTAVRTKALAACVLDLPNNYEVFTSDIFRMRRSGDWLKGYSYGEFLQHPDRPELIHELPVAKAAVKAMDAITAFTQEHIPETKVDRFGLVGYSKLGTAVFVTAAVDERVAAITVGGILVDWKDQLATPQPPTSLAQLGSNIPFGPWLDTLDDETLGKMALDASYALLNLEEGTPQWDRLTSIIDPIHWMDKLAMPKLYIFSSHDEILLSPSAAYADRHLKEFPGQTSFLEVPNVVHDHTIIKARESVAAFFRGVLLNKPAPELDCQLDGASGKITAKIGSSSPPAIRARRWAGKSPYFTEGGFVGFPFEGEDIQETSPGSRVYEAALEAAPEASSQASSGAASGGTFVRFEFEWPEPGFNFTISTPLWLSWQK